MAVKLAINGFGRIGRLSFRRAMESPKDFEVVAINDLTDAATLAYLLRYDSAHRQWGAKDISVSEDGKSIIYKGKSIPVIGQPDPKLIKWSDYGVDIVLECTGRFKGKSDASVHVTVGGAKGVIISAPADKETPTFVYGINSDKLTKDMTVISGASCTTNCLAPIAKVLNDKYKIVSGFMTTVHAYTNDQTILDLPKGNLRRGRAGAQNIVPSTTGAAKAIGLVLPEVDGRLRGGAFRVPVLTGSLVDLTVVVKKKGITPEMINELMLKASKGKLKNVLGYNEDQIVSSDIIGATFGSIFDSTQTEVFVGPDGNQLVKVVSWYDNEYSFTCQYIRLAKAYADVLGIK